MKQTKPKKKRRTPPRQKLLASIHLFEEAIVASKHEGDIVSRKIVTNADLVKMFDHLRESTVQWFPVEPGVVAVGTDGHGLQRYLMVRPARRTRIVCEIGRRRHTLTVAMPNLLAELVAEPSKAGPRWQELKAVYAFAGRVNRLSNETTLCVPPLPNMHDSGKVCMGSVYMKPFARLTASEAFEAAFIKTPFTDHILDTPLVNEGRGRKKQWRNIFDALKKTSGKIPFKELRIITTYGNLFK